MKHRRIRFSEATIADIIEQSDWYLDRSGDALALRWNREIDSAVRRILRNPQWGAPVLSLPTNLRDSDTFLSKSFRSTQFSIFFVKVKFPC
jgi:plasmid stabilization system protein ParE